MHGWDRVPDLNRIASEPMVGFSESKMARSSECTPDYAQKVVDTADIVRDA